MTVQRIVDAVRDEQWQLAHTLTNQLRKQDNNAAKRITEALLIASVDDEQSVTSYLARYIWSYHGSDPNWTRMMYDYCWKEQRDLLVEDVTFYCVVQLYASLGAANKDHEQETALLFEQAMRASTSDKIKAVLQAVVDMAK